MSITQMVKRAFAANHPPVKPLTVTFSDDAWEYLYEILRAYTDKGLSVVLNGNIDCHLVSIVNLDSTGADPLNDNSVLNVHLYDDVLRDYVEQITQIPLYLPSGELGITSIHVH